MAEREAQIFGKQAAYNLETVRGCRPPLEEDVAAVLSKHAQADEDGPVSP